MRPVWGPVLLALGIVSCGRDATSPGVGDLVVRVRFQAQGAQGLGAPQFLEVDSLAVEVRGTGMDPMRVVVPVVDKVASGEVRGVPAGSDRVVEAVAWSSEPRVDLYAGRDTVDIAAGKTTEAELVMYRLLQAPLAHLVVRPETSWAGRPVVADASGSRNPYGPDSLLAYRFLLNGQPMGDWSANPSDTFPAPPKGTWTVGVWVKGEGGAQDTASAALHVRNSPPSVPEVASPGEGQVVYTLSPLLRWRSTDPDGDPVSFTLWVGADSTAVAEGTGPAEEYRTGHDSLTVSGLMPSRSYFWRVVAWDGEAHATGAVWGFSTAEAAFGVSPDSLWFPCARDSAVVLLSPLGPDPLAWTATPSVDWVAVVPPAGQMSQGGTEVRVVITSRAGLAPGTFGGVVVFSAGGYTVNLPVDMEVAPSLGPLPDSLVLVAPSFSQQVAVANQGCGDLRWVATTSHPWLTVTPSEGLVPGGGAGWCTVRGDTARMGPGERRGTVTFQASGASHQVPVILRVSSLACLDVSPDSLFLDPVPFQKPCSLLNCGNVSLSWTAVPADPWVRVVPSSGILDPGQWAVVRLGFSLEGLPSGPVATRVDFLAPGAQAALAITVVVPGNPQLQVQPQEVAVPTDEGSFGLEVRNGGTGMLQWAMSGPPWMTPSPPSGMLAEGQAVQITVDVDRTSLPLGTHTDSLCVRSNGGVVWVRVSVDVGAPGCDDALLVETFATGGGDWHPEAGWWAVEDGRYVAQALGDVAWSWHGLDYVGSLRAQVDVLLEQSSLAAGSALFFAPGHTLVIQGRVADAVAALLDWDGRTGLMAREITGSWFLCGDLVQGQPLPGWNAVAVGLTATGLVALMNGIEVTRYDFGGQIRLPRVGAVGLVAVGTGTVAFDRVFACPW